MPWPALRRLRWRCRVRIARAAAVRSARAASQAHRASGSPRCRPPRRASPRRSRSGRGPCIAPEGGLRTEGPLRDGGRGPGVRADAPARSRCSRRGLSLRGVWWVAPHARPLSMGRMRRKADLPTKTCVRCGRPFTWRREWARDWETVRLGDGAALLRPLPS
ncbi:DUF2256 domain-containing protein [Patulibacter sp. NPDC049589]|uniref:DUF2256 domain-containing protein n=1 Tax=Patulibacter sp. NPDC049589 TaxID=3154731 RepID=UPI00341E4DA2